MNSKARLFWGLALLIVVLTPGCDAPSDIVSGPPPGGSSGGPSDTGGTGGSGGNGTTETCQTFRLSVSVPIRKCPVHTRGDREFAGNGPQVWADARVQSGNGGAEIQLYTHLKAEETRSDWTTAEGSWTDRLIYVPYPFRFRRFLTATTSSIRYLDNDTTLDAPAISGSLVGRWLVQGDTGGNDVGNCTNDDVYMSLTLNDILYEACHD